MLELRPFGGNAQASRIPGTIPDVGGTKVLSVFNGFRDYALGGSDNGLC
jgi:hypothetical protein